MKRTLLLLCALVLLGVNAAWAVTTTYTVTEANGTCYYADGTVITSGFGKKFVSSDNVLTFESGTNQINWGFKNDNGFRINQGNTTSIVAYTLTVPSEYNIVSYTFGAAPNGANGNAMDISVNSDMSSATTISKGGTTSFTKDVNATTATFYLKHNDAVPIDVTLSVVVEVPEITEEQTVTLQSGSSGTFYDSNFYFANGTQNTGHNSWVSKCVTNTTIPVTLDFNADQSLSSWNCYCNVAGSKIMTISLPDGYAIKDYSFTGTLLDNYSVTASSKGGAAVSFPYNESATVAASDVYSQSTTIRFNTSTTNQCRINVTEFTITIVPNENVLEEGVYRIKYSKSGSYDCFVKPDFTVAKGKAGATADDGGDFLFTRVAGTTNTYYIQTLTDGGYLYASGVENVSSASPWQYNNAAAMSKNNTFNDADDKFKWIISKYAESGTYYIRPKSNTNTAIAITSDNNTYLAFYDKTGGYDFALATLTARALDDVIDLYPVGRLTLAFDLEDIKLEKSYDKYVMSSEDQASHLGQTGFPTSEAYSNFTTTFTTSGTMTAQAAIDALLASTVPTSGFYYIQNKGGGTYMFRDENYDNYTAGMTLLNEEERTSKYIWKVDISADGTTANVTSLTGKTITASRNATPYSDMSITSAWLMGYADGYGAYYLGCLQDPMQDGGYTAQGSGNYVSATNPKVVTYWNGDKTNTKAYWQFEPVDESDYDVYNVVIEGAPNDNYLEYTGASTTGNKKVYNGGYYFMTKNAEVSESDFTPQAIEGYENRVSISGSVISVTYWSWQERINTYMEENDVFAKMQLAGTVGYPKEDATASSNLLATYVKIYGGQYSEEVYTELVERYTAYLSTTDIVMPTDGKVYTFTNVHPDGTEYYINSASGTMSVVSTENTPTQYICHKVGDNQFAFISVDDWYWMIAAHNNSGTSVLQSYDENAPLTLSQFYSNCNTNFTPSATPENTFGLIQIIGNRKGVTGQRSVMIINKNGEFNISGGAYFNATYSSAYKLTEVTDYYNKVKLTSDGENAYASLYLPFAVTIPEGITAYAVTGQNGTSVHMEKIVEAGTLPKETAAILKKNGQAEDQTIYLSPSEDAGSYDGDNLLNGTVATEERPSGSTYVLGNAEGFIGLYPYVGTNLAKGKAYLNIPENGVKAMTFDFGGITTSIAQQGIKNINEVPVYDLSGRRVQKPVNGVYIKNGKKIVVK